MKNIFVTYVYDVNPRANDRVKAAVRGISKVKAEQVFNSEPKLVSEATSLAVAWVDGMTTFKLYDFYFF